MKKITFVTCGGTIDKDYATCKGSYDFIIGAPKIKEILSNLRLNIETDIVELLAKDSLDMNDEDRKKVLYTIKTIKSENIIITHGTDTMIETAKILQEIKDKKIILVGSSLPYVFKNSDAEFNIGFAVGLINVLDTQKKYGVYIAMNGQLFEIGNVEKTQEGVFRKISN